MYSQSNERVSSIFVDYALHHLLKTMFVSVPPQKFEPLSMRDFFASLFFQIINVVVNEKRTIPKADASFLFEDTIVAMFKDSISKCETADRETSGRTYSITESFITYFTAFLTASSPDCPLILSLRDRFAQIVAEELKEHLHVWIENADCRTSLLNSSQPLFDYLTAKGLITEKSIQSELKVCQPLIFNDEIGASVARSIQIQVQSTDKSFMSTLNWKTLIPTLVQEEITNEDDKKLYPIREFAVQQRHIEGNEHFLTAIRLFCKYADADMQFKLLEFATNYLVTHLSVNDNILKAISGERPVEHADHPQIFELMLQFALMEYVNGVLARATKNKPKEQENDQPGYFSDSEYIKASIVRKGSAASVSSAMRRAVQNSSTSVASTNASFSSSVSRASNTALQSSTSASGLLPLCTYSTTQEEFVNQHWYNCYTCNMVDTVGVCTVCAVNCHRGHDLSYSKRGSFFCDCGHAKCASMTSTAHAPNATNASMGRTPPLHSPPQTVAPLPNDFVFHQEMQLDWTKIEPFAKIIGELLMTKGGDCMQRLAAACQKGNNLRWKIDEKRQAQLNAIRATHPMQIETDGPAIMEAIDLKMDLKMLIDAKSPAQLVNASTTSISTGGQAQNAANQVGENSTPAADRSRARDMSVVVRLSELAFVWLMVSDGGTTLQIIMPQWSTDLAESLQNARVTTEQLGFVGYRIAASGRKIAISGQNDVLIATINDEGELIEKYSIKINDVIPLGAPPIHVTNQVIKCVWAHTKTQSFVAVVTMQFVRVYDPMQDTTNFVEEMVLPLGNIEDVQLVVMQKKKNERGQNDENMPQTVWALILSSTGLFYEHEIVNSRASNMSYFLTNTIACLPAPNSQMPGHGGSISLFYSEAYNTVFISFEKATMVAAFPEDPSVEEHWKWTKIALPWPVSCWQESSGVITCLNYPQANHLISMSFSENGKLNVQSTNLYRSAFGHQIYTPTTRHTVVSLTFFQDMPTIMAHQLVWRQLTDLWIDGCPLVSHKIVEINEENVADQLAKEDLIPMMEKCEPITRTEITSQILQQHYSTEDLHTRFNTIGASPVVAIQAEEFDVMIRVVEPVVVRAIRIEVPASNYPQEMVIPAINRTVFIFTNVKRFYDICLTRQESMLLENRAIRLTFRHRQPATQHTITIISLRLFGVSSKEFGAMRTQRFCRPPASLPDQIVRAYLYLISKLIAEKSIEADKGKLHKLSEQQLSLKSSHCDVIAAAKHLLRAVTKDRIEYYMFKDKYLIAELKQFDVIGFRLPHDLVLPVIVQLKMAMYTRWKVIDGLIHSVFGSPVAFVQMLCRQLDTCQFTTSLTCLISILEVVIATIFVYVSQNDKNTEKLVSIYFDLFGKSKNPLVAQKIRHLTQVMVYSCSVAARDDRILYKAFKESKQLSLLKFAALRPFYEKARLLTPDDNKADVEQLMGELMNDDDEGVENRDLSWMNYLLTAILHKVNSEININSGLLLGKNDSSSMILIAIVIMSNLNPPKLQPHIEQMVRCIDWTQAKGDDTKVPLVEINDVNYRRLLFLRIISVLISKFTDRLDPKKKIDIVDGRATSVEADYLDENASLTSVSTQTSSTQLDEQSSRKKQIQKMLENIAQLLLENDALDFFLKIALHVAPIWKQGKVSQIRRQQVEANAQNLAARNIIPEQTLEEEHEKISTHYMQLLTDVALKIPAQLKKIKKDLEFDAKWQKVVCEMQSMRNYPSLVKYSKKLLHAICDGDREKCRVMRDAYKMIQQLETLKRKYANLNGHQHEQLTDMVELVGSLNALAAQRLATWKSIAERNINWLLQVACRTVDALASSIIELLLLAIRHTDEGQEQLADHLIADPDNRSLLRLLVLRYLIGREPEHRWLLHKMLRSTIQLANRQNQLLLIRLLLDLWPTARSVGIQGAQLADLIASYAYRLLNSNELATLCQTELVAIGNIMQRMTADGHFETHKEMSTNALGWKSLLLETSPCLSCYSLRSASECHKLMSIKHDVRFSSNAMMFKLASHYEISKLTIRLNDVKRGKSIKKVVVYYCAKNVESAVELKTHRELWQKIANVSVEQNETEINLQLAIPVVTSSLVVQFAELYESRTPPTELHCPRCSTLVTSNPGVCEHCGENVYQCMKCRAINYDEREPFLCQGCGFCKYARIDISAICRQIAGVQPITSDAERAQCVSEMSRLLVTIEQTRAQLKAQRLLLESLWLKCRPLPTVHLKLESPNVAETIVGPHNMTFVPVNFYQPPVAALHSALNNCHLTNQELCIQTQQLIAQREQLRIYDKTDASPELLHESFNQGYYSTSSHCFGCQSAGIIHSLCLVRSACDDTAVLNSLVESDNVFNLLTRLYQFEPMAEEIRELFVLLATTTKEGNRRLCEMVFEGKLPTTLLGKCILTDEDAFWEEKFKVLVKCAVSRNDPSSSTYAFWMMEKLLKEAVFLRSAIFHKMQEENDDKMLEKTARSNDLPPHVLTTNALLDSPQNFVKWLLIDDDEAESKKFHLAYEKWLKSSMFSPHASLRAAACNFLVTAARHPGHSGIVLHLVLTCLPLSCKTSSHLCGEFLQAVHRVFSLSTSIKVRLFLNGAHKWLIEAVNRECRLIYEEEQNETSTSHWFGDNLCHYTQLLVVLLTGSTVENLLMKTAIRHLLKPLLQSTVLLKRVVLRRTRSIDTAKNALETLLKRLSARDPLVLIKAAVESIGAFEEMTTHAHVISIILDVMDPEQTEEEDFLIQIEKDAAQEDFLQA
ncbi:hypothetical protein WR25_08252 isoform B [Diploscapter pachys]|nr:hypothetical protein WR25_08252 isoform B [Diploscapter pachys]